METAKGKQNINPIEQIRISVRSASAGILLLIFGATKTALVAEQISKFSQKDEICKEICEGLFCLDLCDFYTQTLVAYCVMIAGLALIILFSFAGTVQSANPQTKCGQKKSICGMTKSKSIITLILCCVFLSSYLLFVSCLFP